LMTNFICSGVVGALFATAAAGCDLGGMGERQGDKTVS